jgi:dihydropteroate synthase
VQNTAFSTNKTLNLGGRLMDLSQPKVMGILNVTPDSFYEGSRYATDAQILNQTEKMLSEGAAIIDVGGYSSRPGAEDVSLEEERKRAVNAVQLIVKKFPTAILSIDTFRSEVADAAIQEGALMVNDISGGELDTNMFNTVARLNVPYTLMHMRGNPRTMVKQIDYEDILKEMADYFHKKISALERLAVKDIIIDPGFGFAKTREQNFELLHNIDYFKITGKPILAGLSRKSMIWKTLSIRADEALNGTTALNTIALLKGVSILRVHDVKQAVEVTQLLSHLPKD